MTIAVVGPHGAGKSTLGRLLAARLGCRFDHELGEELARARTCLPSDPQASFDAQVFAAELARDASRPPGERRVVETWHPGNLAYAALRSGEIAARFEPLVRASLRGPVVVVPLTAAPEVLAARQWEPGDPAFFARVGRLAATFAARLGLRVLPPVDTGALSPEALVASLLPTLESA